MKLTDTQVSLTKKDKAEQRISFYLHQVIPGQQWKSDMLHQFGHVLEASWLIVLDPSDHSFKHLKDGEESQRFSRLACSDASCKIKTCSGDSTFGETQRDCQTAVVNPQSA